MTENRPPGTSWRRPSLPATRSSPAATAPNGSCALTSSDGSPAGQRLCYQSGGTTSHGANPRSAGCRCVVEDLEDVELMGDRCWATAANYSLTTNCVDLAELFVTP
jgi:hypothetical protein